MNHNLFPVNIFKTKIVPTEKEYDEFNQLLTTTFSNEIAYLYCGFSWFKRLAIMTPSSIMKDAATGAS
jgi:hypothetical protein